MFRKITHIVLAFLLLTATTGFTLPKHHCNMDSGEDMVMGDNDICCVEDESHDCCFNETEYVHLVVDFVSPDAYQLKRIAETDIFLPFTFSNKVNHTEKFEIEFPALTKSPPQHAHGSSQAWLQIFRI